MPLSFSEEGEELADKTPCADLRARLKFCLLDSDCCKHVCEYFNTLSVLTLYHFRSQFQIRKEYYLENVLSGKIAQFQKNAIG